MLVIFNNDKEHPVKMTEGSYDYIESTFHFKNTFIEEQTSEMVNYLKTLKNTTITSIEIQRRNHDFVISFDDLNCHIANMSKLIQPHGDELMFVIFNLDIINDI